MAAGQWLLLSQSGLLPLLATDNYTDELSGCPSPSAGDGPPLPPPGRACTTARRSLVLATRPGAPHACPTHHQSHHRCKGLRVVPAAALLRARCGPRGCSWLVGRRRPRPLLLRDDRLRFQHEMGDALPRRLLNLAQRTPP